MIESRRSGKRLIYIYPYEIYNDKLKDKLREEGLKVVDIRVCKFVEVDIIMGRNEDILYRELGKPIKIIDVENINENLNELVNDCFYWLVHEVLESVWRKSEGEEKDLIHSAILIAVSLVKFCKGEYDIAEEILKRSYISSPLWYIILMYFLAPLFTIL